MQHILQLFSMLLFTFLGVACSPSSNDLLDIVKARGTLNIAMEGVYPPFNFKDPKGQLIGFEVDVGTLLAKELGVKPVFITTEWSGMLVGLQTGKFDIILNQVSITPEREKTFDFSVPYTFSVPRLIMRNDDTHIYLSLNDLQGKKLGVGQGSNYEQLAKGIPGIDVKSYPGAAEALNDLRSGRIDAALNDGLMISYLLKVTGFPLRAGAAIDDPIPIGIPFKKGNPKFHTALNDALTAVFNDGQFERISMKWFDRDVSKAQ